MVNFTISSTWFAKLTSRLRLLGLVMGLLSTYLTLAQKPALDQPIAHTDGLSARLSGRTTQSESLAYSPHGAVGPLPSRTGSVLSDPVVPSGLTRTEGTLLNTRARVDCPNLVDITGNTVLTEWEPARFTAHANGENITYQWQQSTNGGASFSDLPGETNTTLSFDARLNMNGYQYRVIASSPDCSAITSSILTLTVHIDCFIYLDDASGNVSVSEGELARFEVNTFESDVAYQWQQSTDGGASFSDLPGQTNGSLLEIQTTLSQNGNYYRLAASRQGCPTLTSPARKLTVRISCPSYVELWSQTSVPEGWPVRITSHVQGGGQMTYQWQQSRGADYVNMPGETSSDLNFVATMSQENTYRVLVFSPNCPTLISSGHHVSVFKLCPSVVELSGDVSVSEGQPARFSASTDGQNMTYQWQQSTDGGASFSNLPDQTNFFLEVQAALNQHGNYYRVLVMAPNCPTLISPAAKLSVGCPTLSIATQPPSGLLVCSGTPVSVSVVVGNNNLSAGMSYQWYKDGLALSGATTTSLRLANAQPSNAGVYQLVITSRCASLTSTAFRLRVNGAPSPTLLTSGSLNCQTATVTLTAGGGSTYQFSPGATPTGDGSTATVSTAGVYSVTVIASNGCTATRSQRVEDTKTPLSAPNLISTTLTQGVPALSLSASNCSGSLNWRGPNATAGSGPILINTSAVGSFVYSASCTVGRCVSPATSLTVTVQAAAPTSGLSVSHLDGDSRQLANNRIQPYLQVYNEGSSPLAYSQITLRYWLTAEDFSPLVNNLSVNWAQLGASSVKMRYVPLGQKPRQGAYGYIEYRFEPTAGNLAAHSSSGPIQTSIAKNDWTAFNESDDYSYAWASSYTKNSKITAYLNGQLVWGTEPQPISPLALSESLKIYSQTKSSPTTNTISTYVQLTNEGNTPLAYQNLKLRYWLTTDGGQFINFSLDYAQLGPGKVGGQVVRLPSAGQPISANAYLELSFRGIGGDSLYPASNTGLIQYRLTKSDWSNFEQSNDYSYQPMGALALNTRISGYLNGVKVFGSEPTGGSTRQGVVEPTLGWQVRVMGNPVMGSQAELEIAGAGGQTLTLRLVDGQGRLLHEQRIEEAVPVQRVSLPLGENRGQLLLRVSTANEQQSLKLVRP